MATNQDQEKMERPRLFGSCRFTLVVMSFLSVFLLFLMRFNLSIGLVCMTKNGTEMVNYMGVTENWNKEVQGWLLSAFFYGYLSTQIVGGYISDRFGGKMGLFIGTLFISIGSIMIPPLARLSSWLVFLVRILQGMVSGFAFPSVYRIFNVWSSPEERATLMSIVYSAVAAATVVNYPLSSLLCETGLDGGWPMVFYVPGLAGLLLSAIFHFFVYNDPSAHPRISLEEEKYLTNACKDNKNEKLVVPWKAMLTSVPMHALWITHVAFTWCFYLTAVNIPLLAKDVFKMDMMQIGIMSSLPYIGMMIASFTGKLFDFLRMKNLTSLTVLRKIFNSFGFFVPAICTFCLHLTENWIGAISLLILTMSFLQIVQTGGFFLSHGDLVGPYSGLAFGITNTIAQFPGFINALLVAYMTPQGTREEWLAVYDIAGGICILGGLVYLIFGDSTLQAWAQNPEKKQQKTKV